MKRAVCLLSYFRLALAIGLIQCLVLFSNQFLKAEEASNKNLENVRLETISPFDSIKITIYPQEELNSEFSVDADGNINYLFLGKLPVKGMTEEELSKKMAVILNEYLVDPQVTVKIVEKGVMLTSITVLGEVKNPGTLLIGTEGLPLMEAINRAGGFSEFADLENIEVIRYREIDADGIRQERKVVLNAKAIMDGKGGAIKVNPGDTVNVLKQDIRVSVMGEVGSPQRVSYKPGLTLMEAITEAGGPKDRSYINTAEIIRRSGSETITIKKDLEKILEGTEPDYILAPNDIVNVGSVKGQVLVMGQVKMPQTLPLSPKMTLMQAISQVGGFGPLANMNKITLTRKTGETVKKMTFRAKDVLDGRVEDPLLEPGDVIFVVESAI